ncbi:cuticle protein 63-like [Parasteatoda tepidariorum]|uniref:cuticle protein 63-like n=1 Tax=Parasteatoda tepidariorum TaxID=114398 RepID=UPI00077F92F1|nr:cuticle protein 16.5-like [Parasteatoda tepidariorum]
MIAKVAFFLTALAAAHATALLAPAVYGHGLAIKAPAAPIITAPLLSKSVIHAPAAPLLHAPVAPLLHAPLVSKTVLSAPTYAVQKSVVTTHHAAPVAYAAPLPYAVAKTAPIAPVLTHTGLLGAAPLAYTGLLGHGLAYSGHPLAYGHGLYAPKLGYSKLLL